jgi:2-polyprenyl-6-methoxyphenol hydroxylase-like FAD-dependent oxidoreductase
LLLVPTIRHAAGLVQAWPHSGTHTQVEQRTFISWRTERRMRLGAPEEELRRAFAGAGWRVPALLDRSPRTHGLYFDEVTQVMMLRWSQKRTVLLGDAAFAVSLIAGMGATLALAGAVVLADALADRPGAFEGAVAAYEARLRPWAEAAQRVARRNARLFTPADRFQLLAREAVLRLAGWPFLAPLIKRLLNHEGERL